MAVSVTPDMCRSGNDLPNWLIRRSGLVQETVIFVSEPHAARNDGRPSPRKDPAFGHEPARTLSARNDIAAAKDSTPTPGTVLARG